MVPEQPKRELVERLGSWSLEARNQAIRDNQIGIIEKPNRRVFNEEFQMRAVENSRLAIGKFALEKQRQRYTQMRDVRNGNNDATAVREEKFGNGLKSTGGIGDMFKDIQQQNEIEPLSQPKHTLVDVSDNCFVCILS